MNPLLDQLDEKTTAVILRRVSMLSPAKQKKLVKEVENRVNFHRAQQAEWMDADQRVLGGPNKCGTLVTPRMPDEPWALESLYPIMHTVDEEGQQHALTVRLKVWTDWKCQEAVAWNKAMVGQVCANNRPKPMNFSTRMQTDVQTRAIIMWMRLHGRFFWNRSRKSFATSLHFDCDKQILRRIQTDDFKAWLQNHADVNMQKSDFEFLMNEINSLAMNPDIASETEPSTLFKRKTVDGVDYVYLSNGDDEMVKVGPSADGTNIKIVPNGTDDVVFLSGNTLKKWEMLDGPGEDPFDNCPPFSTANYKSRHGKMVARLWFLCLPACQRSFPAIVFTGKRRSGKSRTAKAVCELLGSESRLASIDPGTSGKKDFWTVIGKGGVVCFDNVDTRIDWFSDAIQQACTDGSFESRALFTDGEVSTLHSNARIILTSNNPMFFAESGISDRCQIISLLPFDAKSGKQTMDGELTDCIEAKRNLALTWMARTLSKALADDGEVEGNVNFRHPDFAKFALRCARALNCYDDAVLALKSAEFDKALLTVQTNSTVNYIFEGLIYWFAKKASLVRPDQVWTGTSTQMQELILESHPQLKRADGSVNDKLTPSDVSIGRMLNKFAEDLAVVFDMEEPRPSSTGATKYTFYGVSDAYNRNVGGLKTDDFGNNSVDVEIDNYEEDVPF